MYDNEDQNIFLNDGTTKLFLSTKGKADDISLPLKHFLEYIDGHAPRDELMKEIDKAVESGKNGDEWRRDYMTLALEIETQRAEGKAEGKIELLRDMVRDGILTVREAAGRIGLSEESFRKQAML